MGRAWKYLEVAGWMLIFVLLVFLGSHLREIVAIFRAGETADRLLFSERPPFVVLLQLREQFRECEDQTGGGARNRDGGQYVPKEAVGLQKRFVRRYHTFIDFAETGIVEYDERRGPMDLSTELAGELGEAAECARLALESLVEQGNQMQLDRSLLWAYFFLESPDGAVFVYWPRAGTPDSFAPWERPWYKAVASDAYSRRREIGGVDVRETPAFRDAFSGETIVSLVSAQSVGSVRAIGAVDVAQAGESAIRSRMLVLNFVTCGAILILGWLLKRSLRFPHVAAWYAAWLLMTLLYGIQLLVLLGEGRLFDSMGIGGMWAVVVGLLSIANSGCFALAGYFLHRGGAASRVSTPPVILFVLAVVLYSAVALMAQAGGASFLVADSIEAGVSIAALVLLWRGLRSVLRWCGKTLDPIGLDMPFVGGSASLDWSRVGVFLITTFFVVYGGAQLSLPTWASRAEIEDLFFFLSVPLKVAFAAIFVGVVMIDLYAEKFNANSLYFRESGLGVLAFDEAWTIVSANEAASVLIGLPVNELVGRHMNEVVFASLRESREFVRNIGEAGASGVATSQIRGKQFDLAGSEARKVRPVNYELTASVVGSGRPGRARSLVLIRKVSDKEKRGEQGGVLV